MTDFRNDPRIVLTLDAGGTNMVFGAMKGGEFIVDPLTLPAHSDTLDLCLGTMVTGFRTIIEKLGEKPAAISFAFPGPADYPNGIIGGYLPNFPSFRDGVALGPFLSKTFGVPVFINNDGDLFAYGEALGGILPEINAKLEAEGSSKRYHNLIGYTFGTGFGVGIVVNDQLNRGDNSCVETFCLPHKDYTGNCPGIRTTGSSPRIFSILPKARFQVMWRQRKKHLPKSGLLPVTPWPRRRR